jgi:16S rRNA processing protein RimM
MIKDDFYYLGKILKTYGNKGHLLVLLDVDSPGSYAKIDTVFIGIDNDRIPYFIQEMELRQNKLAVVEFEDVHSIEDAKIFVGRELYLPASMLPTLKGKKFYYHEITGFNVIDEARGNIGCVESVLDLPQQSLMQIRFGDKEILMPIVDKILLKVDRAKKELHIRAPEGLIDIYL